MDIKKRVHEQLSAPVSRKAFLMRAGALLLSLIGITGLIDTLKRQPKKTAYGNSYSSGPYGGGKTR